MKSKYLLKDSNLGRETLKGKAPQSYCGDYHPHVCIVDAVDSFQDFQKKSLVFN